MTIRIVFMGSPDFATPTLKALAKEYPLAGVVTQPDRPAGRGRALTPPPIKILAQELGLPVIQPNRLREPEATDQLRFWHPDLIVVTAFGQILRQEVLDLPPFGCLNIHASLLPRWRGAAPIQAALLNGDQETGISIMRMDTGVDTGPILAKQLTPILADDNTGNLSERLAELGAGLLITTLPSYLRGELIPVPQDDSLATYAPMLKKKDGQLDFNQPAEALVRLVNAFNPWPGAYTIWQDQILKVHRASTVDYAQTNEFSKTPPGTRVIYRSLPAITTSQGLFILKEVQPAGKKPSPGNVFLQGARGWEK